MTAEVTLRPAVQADLLEVLRIERGAFQQPWPFSAFEQSLGAPAFLVAERDGRIAGYVVADTVPNYGREIGHVKDLAVRSDARGGGIGTQLLERALSLLAVEGVGDVKLEARESNDRAMALYRRFGFRSMQRVDGYYPDGEDAVVMVLDLREWIRERSSTGRDRPATS